MVCIPWFNHKKINMLYMKNDNFWTPETQSKHVNELPLASKSASWADRQTDFADTILNWHQNQSSGKYQKNKNKNLPVTWLKLKYLRPTCLKRGRRCFLMKILSKTKKGLTLPIAGVGFGETEGLNIWGQVFVWLPENLDHIILLTNNIWKKRWL